MKKLIIISSIVFLFHITLLAQSETSIDSLIVKGKQQLHHALNTWNEQDMIMARAFFERLQTDTTYPWLIHYYIALADYRLVSFHLSKKNKENAKKYIEDGIDHLKSCIELNNNFAEAHSLLSSLYGNKIGINPLLGITLGPKSGREMSIAMKQESKNPRNYLISGISAYFTPKMFGGGKKKAKINFQQAIVYFDSVKLENPIFPDWGHEEVFAWLGLVNMGNENFESAKKNFNNALKINSEYSWITKILQPDLEKRIEEKNK